MLPSHLDDTAPCMRVSEMLANIANKWTLLIIRALGKGPRRFNELKREIGDISQKMLSSTLKTLEREGLVYRDVTPSTPPQVEYGLTALGRDLQTPVTALAEWTIQNAETIENARARFDLRNSR